MCAAYMMVGGLRQCTARSMLKGLKGIRCAEYARRVRRGCVVEYEDPHDVNAKDARIVKAGICAGFYPQILRVENPLPKFTKLAGAAPASHVLHGSTEYLPFVLGSCSACPSRRYPDAMQPWDSSD